MFAIGGFRSNYDASLTNPILTPQPPNGVGIGRTFAEAELLQIAPTVSYALTDYLSVGFAPTITMAKLSVDPLLIAAPDDANGDGFASYPGGGGNRWQWGGGFQLGLYYIGATGWHWGASVKSPQWFEEARFKTEDELGRPRVVTFDVEYPLIVSVGTGYNGFERWVLACDVRYFDYGNASGLGDSGFDASGALQGLAWRSIVAVSTGAQYEVHECLFLRTGYSYNQNPIRDVDSGFNVASPVISQHFVYTGGSLQFSPRTILSATYVHAFENEVSGPVQTPFGPIPGSTVTSRVSLDALSLALTVRY
jgi:long-chain fatty acid transport protein